MIYIWGCIRHSSYTILSRKSLYRSVFSSELFCKFLFIHRHDGVIEQSEHPWLIVFQISLESFALWCKGTVIFPTDSFLKSPIASLYTHFIRVDGNLHQIALSDIVYVEGLKDYVKFYIDNENRPLISHLTMKSCEEMLPASQFMRVNRS